MIRVTTQRDVFSAPAHRSIPWGVDCTARDLAPSWADVGDPQVGCARNGKKLEPGEWGSQLADGDHVFFWTRPGFQVAVGSALFAQIGNAILFSAYAYILTKLLLPAKKPVEPGDESSPTYGFTGLRNNARGDGLNIPIEYGRHRVTPPAVNEYIRSSFDTDGNPLSEYLGLFLVSEGVIRSIGNKTVDGGPFTVAAGSALATLQINGQPAENFEGVEAHVRLGNLDQEPIAEFADPVISRDANLTMKDPEILTHATSTTDVPSATTAIATTGSFAAGNSNITKWNTETSMVSLVGVDTADEFTVLLELSNGLIAYQTDGTPITNSIIYQIRYVEVDGGGTPTGNYIVLDPRQVTLKRAGRFIIEDKYKTFNPATYSATVFGKFAESRTTGSAHPGIAHVVSTSYIPAAPASLQLTIACWLRIRNTIPDNVTRRIWQWTDAAGNEGLRINLVTTPSPNISSVDLFIGTGTAFQGVGLLSGGSSEQFRDNVTTFQHLVVTYEASFDGTNTRVRVYLDGVLRRTVTTPHRAVLDTTQPIRFLSDSPTAPTVGLDANLDEVAIFSRALSAYEVASLFNGRAPVAIDPTMPGLIVSGEFDAGQGTTPNIGAAAFGPYVGAIPQWVFGSGTNAGTDPIISASSGVVKVPLAAQTPRRAKWRIDLLRLDTEDVSATAISDLVFAGIQWRTYQQFEFPGMALLAVRVPATDQLNGSAPVVSVIAEGRLIPVWDGVDPVYPNMPDTYSRSPAWIAADIATNKDYGLGDAYQNTDLDVGQFAALATLAGERIYDNMPRQPMLAAAYLDSAAEAVTFSGTNLGIDVVRYRVAALPSHFPQVSTVATEKYLKPILTGLLATPPAWLTNQAALAAQEVVYVEWRQADTSFYIYTRTTLGLGAGQATWTYTSGSTTSNGLEQHDVRFRFDGYFDRSDVDAWDALIQVFQTARAAPLRLGSRLSCFVDDVGSPVMLVGMGNIVEGSWRSSFQDIRDRPNAESAEFFDEDKNFERDSVADEHPELVDPSKLNGFRWRRMRIEGVTRRSQVKRSLRRDLNAYFLLRRRVEFELGIDGMPAQPGDLIAVSHDVPGYGTSGRIYEDATVGTSIKLDRAVVLDSGVSYQVHIESAASETRETKPVTSAAGTYPAGSALTIGSGGFTFLPLKNDKYALGGTIKGETKTFRLVETSFNPRAMTRRCVCVEYDAAVYSDDFGTLPEVSPTNLPVPSAPIVPSGVENLTVGEVVTRGPDGSVSIGASLSFTHMPETFHAVGWTDVYVTKGTHDAGRGAADLVATLSPKDVVATLVYPFARNSTYTVWVVPRTRDGATAYRAWASWVEFTARGLAVTPPPPSSPRVTVTGDQAVHEWGDSGELDHGAIVEVRQGGWLLGVPVASAPAQARRTAPVASWAAAPTNARGAITPELVARTKTRTGQYSEAVRYSGEVALASDDGRALAVSEEDAW